MSKENISETTRSVKRKRRTIPEGMRLTVTEVRGLPRRTRGPDKNLLVKIRRRYIRYIAACPYLNSNEKIVINKVAEWFNLSDGFARAAYVTLAESTGVSPATVKRALRTAYDAGLMGIKTGGQSTKGSFGPVANKYVPAFRLVINAASGLLIENAPYHFLPRKVNGEAKSVGQKPVGQIDPIVETPKPNGEAKSLGQIDPVHANVGGASASPARADAPSVGAPRKKENATPRKIGRILSASLAEYLGLTWEGLIELITGGGTQADIEKLDDLCKRELFNMGKPTAGLLAERFPIGTAVFGHVVICGLTGKVEYNEKGANHVQIGRLSPDQWLAIDYRSSPDYLIEVEKKLREIATGI